MYCMIWTVWKPIYLFYSLAEAIGCLESEFFYGHIYFETKVRLVKAMVFPVVMYGCESWTIKKAERGRMMLLNCGVGEDS